MRFFIEFQYNGTNYHGWQSQPNAVSVQETMEKAMSLILRQPISLTGAGRTDTGVHARQMYAHFDFDLPVDSDSVTHKLNSFLPKDIAVYRIINVAPEAHARFDASRRTYEYHIHTAKNPFLIYASWELRQPLDIVAMNEAAALLLNHTDFQCFSKVDTDVHTFNCRIFAARWDRNGEKLVFTISADRFLRNMVRAIVGTMIAVGQGKITAADVEKIILSRDRQNAGASVPAHGLYLTQIQYEYIK